MKIKLLLLIPFLLVMTSSTDEAYFWGQNGHRVTGKIAEKHLTRKTKKCIDKILKGQSLAFVSTYADEIKSDRKYRDYNVWHYVNMDLDQTYEQAEKNPQGDLVQGIEKCIAVLKDDNSADEDKVFHLKMLVSQTRCKLDPFPNHCTCTSLPPLSSFLPICIGWCKSPTKCTNIFK